MLVDEWHHAAAAMTSAAKSGESLSASVCHALPRSSRNRASSRVSKANSALVVLGVLSRAARRRVSSFWSGFMAEFQDFFQAWPRAESAHLHVAFAPAGEFGDLAHGALLDFREREDEPLIGRQPQHREVDQFPR